MSAETRSWCGRSILAVLLPLTLGACEWFSNFTEQPALEPWEVVRGDTVPPRANPETSVPVTGVGVPAYVVSYQPMPATVDSLSALANPVPASDSSLLRGRKLYQINCAVCHGPGGNGNGPVVPYGYPPISLTTDRVRNQLTDGYLYGMIRNGRGSMPSYNRIEELERWDVVNYLRALQGRVAIAVDTLPVGAPGETGDAIPGATTTAPTRPAPYLLPDSVLQRVPAGARVPWLPPSMRPPAAQGAGSTQGVPAASPPSTPPPGDPR